MEREWGGEGGGTPGRGAFTMKQTRSKTSWERDKRESSPEGLAAKIKPGQTHSHMTHLRALTIGLFSFDFYNLQTSIVK